MLAKSWADLMPWNRTRGYFEGAVFAFRSKNRAMAPGIDRDLPISRSWFVVVLSRKRIQYDFEGSRKPNVSITMGNARQRHERVCMRRW
jgi:hypothetical protein